MTKKIHAEIEQLAAALKRRGWMAGTAESCTGGLVSAALTDVVGSSEWFSHTVVAYSYEAKTSLLGVPESLLVEKGAVSKSVARAMVEGMLEQGVDVAVAITGVAGPGGGTVNKPVGTVWMAYGGRESIKTRKFHFEGSRSDVRRQATKKAVRLLRKYSTRSAVE